MDHFWAIATLALVGGMIRGDASAVSLYFQPIAISLELQEALAYPTFLQDLTTAQTYRQVGLQARQQGYLADAIASFKLAVVLAPRVVSGYVLLGWTQHLAGQRNEAVESLTRALEQDSEDVPALNALGIVYLVKGDLGPAIEIHTQAKTLKPDNEIAYYNLSLAYQRLPEIPLAIENATRATELEPYNPHPWVALALTHWSNQDFAAAATAYQEALRLDGRYFQAYHLDHLTKAGFSPEQIQVVDEIRLALQ